MIEYTGDLFDSEANYLGHGVNTKGFMGAGIAKQFRDKFPNNYAYYKEICQKGSLVPGGHAVGVERDQDNRLRLIVNLASQDNPGPDATYEWLLNSLVSFAKEASQPNRLLKYGGTVAIPEIGCGIGGLEWDTARLVLLAVEAAYPDIEFEVWHCDK